MKVAVIGLGLIGGSLAMSLRSSAFATELVGCDADPTNAALALERGAVDRLAAGPADAVLGAELVVVATPPMVVRDVFRAIAPALSPGAIVTDVASTKSQIMNWAAEWLPATSPFVGGHPMAGSEKAGMAAARLHLLRGALYLLSPSPEAPASALAILRAMVFAIGARPLVVSPDDHDAAVAAVSHMPFIAATAIVKAATADPRWEELFTNVASTGFKDTTRIASGDPAMYRGICLTNAAEIRPVLQRLAAELNALADHLDDPDYLTATFTEARDARNAWMRSQNTFRLP